MPLSFFVMSNNVPFIAISAGRISRDSFHKETLLRSERSEFNLMPVWLLYSEQEEVGSLLQITW
jgi:hypothetical protein